MLLVLHIKFLTLFVLTKIIIIGIMIQMFTGSNLSYTRNKLYNFLIKLNVTFKKQS